MTKVSYAGLSKNYGEIKRKVAKAAIKSHSDVTNDLNDLASQAAPVDEGVLEGSGEVKLTGTYKKRKGTVKYEAWSNAKGRSYDFNYAIWIHESDYNLGPLSRLKAGPYGMSGTYYEVGKHYLTRPLEGEKDAYRDYIEDEIKNVLR